MRFAPAGMVNAGQNIYEAAIPNFNHDIGRRDGWIEPLNLWKRQMAMNEVAALIANVAARQENWDGYGSAEPNENAVMRSVGVISSFYTEAIQRRTGWITPFVGLNERGDVVFEWWNDHKKLSLYVGPDTTDYVSSWGLDIEEQMDAGAADSSRFGDFWTWLTTKSA